MTGSSLLSNNQACLANVQVMFMSVSGIDRVFHSDALILLAGAGGS